MTREGHIAVTDCQGKRVKVSNDSAMMSNVVDFTRNRSIPLIATHFSIACGLYVCRLSHSYALLKWLGTLKMREWKHREVNEYGKGKRGLPGRSGTLVPAVSHPRYTAAASVLTVLRLKTLLSVVFMPSCFADITPCIIDVQLN